MNRLTFITSLTMLAYNTVSSSTLGTENPKLLQVAYVETNSTKIDVVGRYKDSSGKPVFDMAVIFAANINYSSAENRAVIFLNPQVNDQLNNRIGELRALQRQGIKVLVTLLGNHQNAGWSCFKTYEEGERFALELKQFVEKYSLDGIDIDDEYSRCKATYRDSLVRVTTAMRQLMPNLIISKALWLDYEHFEAEWNGRRLADNLDYGWEMSYASSRTCLQRVSAYLERGMTKDRIGVGTSTVMNTPAQALAQYQCSRKNGLAGTMIFNLNERSGNFAIDPEKF